MHIEFLVEEESCAAALELLVPKIVGTEISFFAHIFQGKQDLLNSLPARLSGYAKWLPRDWRVVVLVDRDNDDCRRLKAQLEDIAAKAGLTTRSAAADEKAFQVVNRIAVEELEAWFLGDVPALVKAFPKVPATLSSKKGFRDSDAVAGGTWEALERQLQQAGYYRAGIPKIEVARSIAMHMLPDANRSRSFQTFRDGLKGIVREAR